MSQLHPAWVDAHQLKGWARNVRRRAKPAHDSTHECRLACAKIALEKNEVALRQPLPNCSPADSVSAGALVTRSSKVIEALTCSCSGMPSPPTTLTSGPRSACRMG